jgi:hypothetical protein
MLPVFLFFGFGAAIAAYVLSPKFHLRVDDYARAIKAAHAAHVEADVHLANADAATAAADQHAQAADVARQLPPVPPPAPPSPSPPSAQVPPPPPPAPVPTVADAHDKAAQTAADAGVDHAAAGQAANQEAAKNTAAAGKLAKTEPERQAVAQSAAKVIEREKRITQALANLDVSQCGVRTYARVTPQTTKQLLDRLHNEGMTVTGDNPWDIDTHQYDVRLRAVWDPKTSMLKLIVTAGKGSEALGGLHIVTCADIWDKVDPIMKGVIGG